MKTRWVIAIAGVVALAALTVSTQMPWLFKEEVTMTARQPGAPSSELSPGGPAATSEAPLTCPADAKPANLDFTLKDHTGADVSLASYKGKVIVIDFWATWCGPCKVEIPHFVEFQNKYGKDGLQIIGISVDDTAEKLAPYVSEMKMNYPVLQGLNHDDVQEAYGPIVGIPVAIVISRDSKVCATHTGLTGKDVFEREIKALL